MKYVLMKQGRLLSRHVERVYFCVRAAIAKEILQQTIESALRCVELRSQIYSLHDRNMSIATCSDKNSVWFLKRWGETAEDNILTKVRLLINWRNIFLTQESPLSRKEI